MQTPPPPVKIKVYGLITVTKRGYRLFLSVTVVLLLVLLARCLTLPEMPAPDPKEPTSRNYQLLYLARHYLPWLVVLAFGLAGLEAYFIFRRFAQEEARQASEQTEKNAAT